MVIETSFKKAHEHQLASQLFVPKAAAAYDGNNFLERSLAPVLHNGGEELRTRHLADSNYNNVLHGYRSASAGKMITELD